MINRKSWHPGFQGATELELKANKDDLTYEYDHPLSKEPLRMDALIIKKNPGAVIQSDIGKHFRTHNVVEYKGWHDALNIDVVYKVLAYACLYKSLGEHVDEIPANEVAITIMRAEYPRDVFETLEGTGVSIHEEYPGIYYLTGRVQFATQIIAFSRLDESHPGYRILREGASREDVIRFLEQTKLATEPWEINDIKALLEVSTAANEELYEKIREVDDMGEALERLFKDDIAKARKAGRNEGREERDREKIADMLSRGKTAQAIADFCGYPLNLVRSVEESLQTV